MIQYIYSKIIKKLRGSAIINSHIDTTSKVESGSQIVSVNMDKYSFCGYDCEIIDCEIGKFCSIANKVIIGGAMHPISWACMSPAFYKGRDSIKKKFAAYPREKEPRTIIGNDVWIGHSAMIKAGVKIGNGAVIGMGAIVTKDVPAYTIVGGNPAKLIRMRFDDTIIEQLNQLEWWNLDDEKIQQCAPFIKEPLVFIEKVKELTKR